MSENERILLRGEGPDKERLFEAAKGIEGVSVEVTHPPGATYMIGGKEIFVRESQVGVTISGPIEQQRKLLNREGELREADESRARAADLMFSKGTVRKVGHVVFKDNKFL